MADSLLSSGLRLCSPATGDNDPIPDGRTLDQYAFLPLRRKSVSSSLLTTVE